MANVLKQRIDPRKASLVPAGFLRGFNCAQLEDCLTARFFRGHSRSDIVVDMHQKVALDLGFKVSVLALLAEQVAEPRDPSSKFSHTTSFASFRKLARIEEICQSSILLPIKGEYEVHIGKQ
jgi:hypothetical protein